LRLKRAAVDRHLDLVTSGRTVAVCAGAVPGVILAFGVAAAGVAGSASAQSRSARAVEPPPVAKYVGADERAFVLDRSTRTPLLKFEDSAEVWVLRPAPGPRGDVIYKDDLGRQVVRASRFGGVTVFTADSPSGLPAALAGQAGSIRPAAISPASLFQHFLQQSRRVYRGTRRKLYFETVQDATPGTATLLADAATVAAEAITRFRSSKGERGRMAQLRAVRFSTGLRPAVGVTGTSLEITVAPSEGLAGRPSSERIVRTMSVLD
jgi:hypothetical protein